MWVKVKMSKSISGGNVVVPHSPVRYDVMVMECEFSKALTVEMVKLSGFPIW
jgi:hypothetical protein